MASIDVIRGHARLKLSIKPLYCQWFKFDGVPVTPRDVEDGHDVEFDLKDGSPEDLDRYPHDGGLMRDYSFARRDMETVTLPEMDGREDGGVVSTAIMASENQAHISATPSSVLARGGRDWAISSSNSFLSCLSTNETVTECLEELSSLSIADDGRDNHAKLSPAVKNLLETLRKFDVRSSPVIYHQKEYRKDSSEIFCKNLFLKDRRGHFYLIICDEDQDVHLKTVRRKLKAYRNFSFATPEEMAAILQVTSGGVTPFALMNGTARDVRVAMTTNLTTDPESLLNFHPLDQTLTLPVNLHQLEQFLKYFRFDLEIIDMES